MKEGLFQVDAFADRPFSGNPAAVCLLKGPAEEAWMQDVAREMNLSETAFLHEAGDGFGLRWFTPKFEVELCGHATLASSHVLWEEGILDPEDPARFLTKSGLLLAHKQGDWIEMDFPSRPAQSATAPASLLDALGVEPTYVGKSRYDYLVEVRAESEVLDLKPDFAALLKAPSRGIMVTSRTDREGYDFASRFFAPAAGIDEDPVTGSAHCTLGPHWRDRLGKDELLAYQASERGGTVRVRVGDDRVHLGGQAVTVFRGSLV